MTRTCQSCNQTFEGRSHAKTCSAKCRKQLQRMSLAAAEAAQNVEVKVGSLAHRAEAGIKHDAQAVTASVQQLVGNEAGFAAIAEPLQLPTNQPIQYALRPIGQTAPQYAPAAPQQLQSPRPQVQTQPQQPLQGATLQPLQPASQPAPTVQQAAVAQALPGSLPAAESLESGTTGVTSASRNNFSAQLAQPQAAGKRKFHFNRALVKIAGVALLITLMAGGWGLYIGNRSGPSQPITVAQSIPEQTLNLSVIQLGQLTSGANYNQQQELLVQGDGIFTGNLTAANLFGNGNNLTNLNAANITGTLSTIQLPGNVTLQGNAFNGPGQLVQLTGTGALPALDGSNLLNLPGGSGCGTSCVNLQASSPGTAQTGNINASGTIMAGIFSGNGANLTSISGSNISSGTVADARLSTNVTIQGNTFNGASQLVQTTAGGVLPVISGINLTSLDAAQISLGTLSDSRLSGNVALLNGSQTFTGDPVFRNSADSATAFQIQNAAGNNIFAVDTTGAQVTLGKASTATGKEVYYNASGSGSITLQAANPVAVDYTITLPADTGTVCLTSGNCVGVGGTGDILNNGNSFGAAVTLGTNDNFGLNLEANNTAIASFSNSGAVQFKNASNSTTAFQIQDSAGTSNLFVANTTNTRIAIAQASASYTLDVGGDVNTTGTYRINGTAICTSGGCTPAAGSSDYVQLQSSTPGSPQTGNLNISGTAIAGTFSGSGASLTSLNGSNISSGTVADARLSGNVALLNGTGPQTFSGNNQFTGSFLAQNAADSITAFQIQNAAGSSNLFIADTLNNRIGIGIVTPPVYNLDVAGDINITGAYRIGGTAICTASGCTSASGSGNYIQNQSASDQTADFRISGTGRANTALQAPLFDTATAATLALGNTTATAVSICNSAACDTIDIGNNADADIITVGDTLDTVGINGSLTVLGTSLINSTGTLGTTIGNATGTLTLTGSAASSFVLNGVTVDATEFNLLDGHDAALVDTNDAVATAITGTGILNAGSITSGFGSIDIGADTITSGDINSQTISSSANFTGTVTIQGSNALTLGVTGTATGAILFEGSTGASGTLTLIGPANPSANSLTLPNETGVLCSTGSVCSGYAPSSGSTAYATRQLDNLTSVAINTALLPNADNTIDLGSIANSFSTLYADTSVLTPGVDVAAAGTLSLGTTTATAVNIGNGSGSTSVSVLCGTGTCGFGNNATDHSSVLGSTTGTSATTLQGGTGGINIGIANVAQTIQIGNTANAVAQTINIGNNATASSTSTVNIGSTIGTSPVTINAGTSGILAKTSATQISFQIQNSSSTSILDINTLASGLNLISNSNFESNANGWAVKGSATSAAFDNTASNANFGNATLKVVTTAASDGAKYSFPFAPSTQYTASFYAKIAAGSINFIIGWQENGSDVETGCSATAVTTTWTQFTCTFTTGATINSTSNLYFRQTGAGAQTLYLDGVTLVTGATALAFVNPAQNLQVDTNYNNITLNSTNTGEIQPWQLNANALPAVRTWHSSVIANGYVYVIGGYNGSTYQSTVYYAKLNSDGSTGAWQTSANALPANRAIDSSIAANGYVYVIGGYDGSNYSTVYYAKLNSDGSTGTWQTNANALPALRREHTSVAANGYVYVIGGENSGVQSTVYYAKLNSDGSTGTWQTNANALPAAREKHTSVIANGYVYVIGGLNGTYQSTVYYAKLNSDGSTGTWSTNTNTLPAIRGYLSSVIANGYVYAIGGLDGSTYQSTVYYAKLNSDGSTGTWQTNANALPAAREKHTSVIANGYVYVIGGLNGTYQSTVYYAKLNSDGSTGTWQTSINSLPAARQQHTSVVANGYIYTLGGSDGSATQSTVYYTSTSRILAGGSLDLVGLGGQVLGDVGGTGGSLTAANGTFVGDLQVQGVANFAQAVSVGGSLAVNGSVNIQTQTDSKTGFQVQGSTTNSIIDVNTTTLKNLLNEGNFEGAQTVTPIGGWAKYNGAETTFQTSTDASHFQLGAQSLKTVTDAAGSIEGTKYIFPFKANTTYTFSAYVSLAATAGTAYAFGANINGSDATCTAPNGGTVGGTGLTWTTTITRYVCVFTTGATVLNGTDFLFVRRAASDTTARTIYIDGAQLELGSGVTNYTDPIALNLVGNPSFEQGTNGWSAKASGTTIATDETYTYSGNRSLKVVTTTTANAGASYNVPLLANTTYTLSGYAKVASSTIADFVVGRQDNGSDNTCLTAQTLTTTYTRFTCTFTTGTTVNTTTNIFFQKSGASAETFYLDAIQLEQTYASSSYQEAFNNLQVDTATSTVTLNGSNSGEIQPWKLNANAITSARELHSSVVANGYVYVMGGVSGSTTVYYAKLNADGSTGAWSTNTNVLPATRALHSSVVANGYVYVIGGSADSGSTAESTVFYAKLNADGSTNAWSTNANALPAVREYHTSITANGYVYVIGGNNSSATQSTVFYAKLNADGSTGAWQTNTNGLPAVRYSHSSITANGYVYVIGGLNNGGTNQSTVYYAKLNTDGSTGVWSTNANALPAARESHSSVVANGYAYVIGGNNVSVGGGQSTVYYAKLNANGSAGTWSTAANALPVTRYYHSSVVVNGYIYVLGGYVGGSPSSTVYYTSTSRILAGGSLDLVGLGGQLLGDVGGTGGSLTAGDTTIVGGLTVQGQASFNSGIAVNGSGTFNGELAILSQANNTPHTFSSTCSCLVTSAAGTFGAETGRDAAFSSAVYNGQLYAATKEADASAVYVYDSSIWTKVSFSTVGKIVTGDTANIDASVLAVYNGKLYAGTQTGSGTNTGAVYAYDGTSWSLVNATRGTFGGESNVDGVSAMQVSNGRLYVYTQEANAAAIYRYDGSTTFTKISDTTAGKIVAGDAADVDEGRLVDYGGNLWAGTVTGASTGRVAKYDGNAWTIMNTTQGTFAAGTTGVDDVTSMAVYNDQLFVGTGETDLADIYVFKGGYDGGAGADVFFKTTATSGRIDSTNDATDVDSVPSMRVYNGRLYAGSNTGGLAAVYEYTGISTSSTNGWTIVNGTRGTFGAQTGLDSVDSLQEFNGSLYVGTEDTASNDGAVYSYTKNSNNSYALKFGSSPNTFGSISFVGTQQTSSNANNTGSFVFSNGIMATAGAYDVAEDYPTRDGSLAAGDLVSIDPSEPGFVKKTTVAGDSTIVGIYSAKPALRLSQPDSTINGGTAVPVALAGRVSVNATNENGAIAPGDYLTSSTRAGYAAKATKSGPVIGKALEAFDSPSGKILVFVNISHYDPSAGTELQGTDVTFASLNVSGLATIQTLTVSGLATIQNLKVMDSAEFFGNIRLAGAVNTKNAITRIFKASHAIAAGSAVVADPGQDGYVTTTNMAQDTHVIGIAVADAHNAGDDVEVAIGGSAQVRVEPGSGIANGDLLSTSSTDGAAMKYATPPTGSVLGKATSQPNTAGLVWVLITLQ